MKLLLVLSTLIFTFQAKAVADYSFFAEGRSATGDSSAFPNVTGYTDKTTTGIGGGFTVSARGKTFFFTTGAIYVPRTFVSTTNTSVDLIDAVNTIDIPAWIGMRLGWLALYAGADAGLKISSTQTGFANNVTIADESTIIAPQAGLDLILSHLKISAFYEPQIKIGTATAGGLNALIRGQTIGARFGFLF